MSRTRSLVLTSHTANISLVAIGAVTAFLFVLPLASASAATQTTNYSSKTSWTDWEGGKHIGNWTSGGGGRGTGGGEGKSLSSGFGATGPGVGRSRGGLDSSALERINEKIAELEARKAELFGKLEKRGGTASSTKDSSGHGNWRERYCSPDFLKTAKFSEAGYAQYLKTCERWNKSSTTPDVRPPKASTTPMVKLLQPNGKVVHKHRIDGAVIISWKNTTKDKAIDIDLKKGSTTTSIAKDVKGKKHAEGGDSHSHGNTNKGGSRAATPGVLGAFSSGPSSFSMGGGGSGRGDCNRASAVGPSSFGGGFSNKGNCGNDNKGTPHPTYSYRWVNAPEGEGYQIVITAKDGDKTYTDESKVFSVKKLPKGTNWYEEDEDESEVLGASTSAEADANSVLNQLEDTLIEMKVALSS